LIGGTPTVTGTFHVTLGATNAGGTGFGPMTITVQQPPSVTNGPPPTYALVNALYNFTYTTGGYPAPTYSVTSGALPTGLALSSTGIISGAPTALGAFAGSVTATNGVSPDATQNFNITVLNPFGMWETAFFTAKQMQDVTISGPNATPQHDHVPNLLKYVFDINPSVPMSTTDKAALPQVAVTTVANVSYLTLTYRKNPDASGITVNVQTSPDLQTWTTVKPDLNQNVGTDPATGDPIVQVGVKTVGSKLFIRLNVTSP
jgi:hypothetical protein